MGIVFRLVGFFVSLPLFLLYSLRAPSCTSLGLPMVLIFSDKYIFSEVYLSKKKIKIE